MILIFHIAIAIASIAYATYLLFSPSDTKFYVSYALVGLTLMSGTYLVVVSGAPILSSCTTGLIYLAIVSTQLGIARARWATQRAERHE
ncbi:MAG TPA: hypothetical protein VLI54_06640 [Bacillota bacterium]|nr:hypothetical protein [Bacillota bacterium]